MAARNETCRLEFHAVSGYFVDRSEMAEHDPGYRAVTLPGLGLVDREYEINENTTASLESRSRSTPWHRFRDHVDLLNKQSEDSASYKVLFITRHGLGYHNTFEAEVGHDAWNQYWSHLDGDGTVVWADAQLNEQGINQAKKLGEFWSKSIAEDQMPIPDTIYTSPLARCLETTRLAFAEVFESNGRHFQPIVKESLRELVTDHTCDRRSPRSWIEEHYPDYLIEAGFTEEDKLWTGGQWETPDQHTARKQQVLEDIFTTDQNAFVALTVHSYAVSAILRVIGLSKFRLQEGSCIALLVRADRISHN